MRDAFAPEDAEGAFRTFVRSLCPHEVAMLSSSTVSRDCLLLSMPDARSPGSDARVLLLCTHCIVNECDPGCFCAGQGYDCVDVIFPGESEPTFLWAFSNGFNQQEGFGHSYELDMGSPAAAQQLALAAGMRASDVNLVLAALSCALYPTAGEAMRTCSDFEMFQRLVRCRLAKAAESESESDEDDDYDDYERREREEEERDDYILGRRQGEDGYVDPYPDVTMPVYPSGYGALAEMLPRTGVLSDVAKPLVEDVPDAVAVCDVTQKDLDLGDWHHKVGKTYDLCTEEYEKLNATNQKMFVRVKELVDLGADLENYLHKEPVVHKELVDLGPIIDDDDEDMRVEVWPGPRRAKVVGVCDVSRALLTAGNWFHRPARSGRDESGQSITRQERDLSKAEYLKLSPAKQREFREVTSSRDVGRPEKYYMYESEHSGEPDDGKQVSRTWITGRRADPDTISPQDIRRRALAWLLTIDRSSLLSVFQATKGWGDRFSIDRHTRNAEAMEAQFRQENPEMYSDPDYHFTPAGPQE